MLTQYNIPRYIVLTLDEYSGKKEEKVLTQETTESPVYDRCSMPYCKNVADSTGKLWDEVEGWSDKPMCKFHAVSSLREYNK